MCSGCARVHSSTICHGSTPSGLLAIVTEPTCGVALRCEALGALSELLESGRHAGGAPKCPMLEVYTEDQITKLKLVKRQMYGRAKLDLLQARLIGAT
jgi:hypothetical protein